VYAAPPAGTTARRPGVRTRPCGGGCRGRKLPACGPWPLPSPQAGSPRPRPLPPTPGR